MFSSHLPPPVHSSVATIQVHLPKKTASSKALLAPEQHSLQLQEVHYGQPSQPQVAATLDATIPLKTKYPLLKHFFPRYTLRTCPDDSLATCVEQTKAVVDRLLGLSEEPASTEASFVHYKNNSLNPDNNTHNTLLEIRTYKEDPMLPPKFKLRKNREQAPPPPPPVLKKSTAEKVTKEMKDKWHIPSAVSNWKNNQGFAIALDKRVKAASGGTVAETAGINIEKFSQLSSALETADKTAREELTLRNQERMEAAQREQAEKERKLESLLEKSRALKSSHGLKRSGDPDQSGRKRQR